MTASVVGSIILLARSVDSPGLVLVKKPRSAFSLTTSGSSIDSATIGSGDTGPAPEIITGVGFTAAEAEAKIGIGVGLEEPGPDADSVDATGSGRPIIRTSKSSYQTSMMSSAAEGISIFDSPAGNRKFVCKASSITRSPFTMTVIRAPFVRTSRVFHSPTW